MFVINPQKFVVSTHSRLKAAGKIGREWKCFRLVSTHSRLKAAGSETAS